MPKKGQKKKKKKKVEKKEEVEECCEDPKAKMMCCCVEAIVPMDGRGQVVLPKSVRKKAKLKAGDRFAVITSESQGGTCCIMLLKADDFSDTIKVVLGPMVKDIME